MDVNSRLSVLRRTLWVETLEWADPMSKEHYQVLMTYNFIIHFESAQAIGPST